MDLFDTILKEVPITKEGYVKDIGDFYRVPADIRDLNYDEFFKEGDSKRVLIDEFNSNDPRGRNLE